MTRRSPFPVIDLFAGPGGLNEGFSLLGESDFAPAFKTVGSFEMDPSACKTLRIRSAFRHLVRTEQNLDPYFAFVRGEISFDDFCADEEIAEIFNVEASHVYETELGPTTRSKTLERIRSRLAAEQDPERWVLVGGPPCQAYSLVGRSRRTNDATFADDHKHFLYREYLEIIRNTRPPVFVMENVKGLLSSRTTGVEMFDLIKSDLESPGDDLHYRIFSLAIAKDPEKLSPYEFIVRSENFGVPQSRHRLILLGIRSDLAGDISPSEVALQPKELTTVKDAIHGLPPRRSGLSREKDSLENWNSIRQEVSEEFGLKISKKKELLTRGEPFSPIAELYGDSPANELLAWLEDSRVGGVIQHETRSHMSEDLRRYAYLASKSEGGVSPRLTELPVNLLPLHKNAQSEFAPFLDRFKVQVWDKPSSTVVSHIAKDGHYFVHPDASQMRSLTVREAARLQTFPDNFYFAGNRTQQYTQIGNAVPPLLAYQIAEIVQRILDKN
jgi:DNA (cytosine-5)-methyltransferase 1